MRRLLIVNAAAACLLMFGLALNNEWLPAIVLLLLTFSTAVSCTEKGEQ